MTVSGLKRLYERNNPKGLFFNGDTLRFFGDAVGDFKVYGKRIKVLSDNGVQELEVWDLHRKKPVKNGSLHGHCAYFRKDNGQVVFNHA